jgi:hypothetical protein
MFIFLLFTALFSFIVSVFPFIANLKISATYHFNSNLKMSTTTSNFNFGSIMFDCDGVIAETERDAHRVTFNEAFKSKGINVDWNVELYGELLKIGGGKERMTAYFNKFGWPATFHENERENLIKDLHKIKTEKFQAAVESGIVPIRPGGFYLFIQRNIKILKLSLRFIDLITLSKSFLIL